MRGLWIVVLGVGVMIGCGGGGASAEHATVTASTGDETPSDPPAPTPQPGSPECAGCTYSATPGYPDASGRGGLSEWCGRNGPDGAVCAMSCCR